MISMYSHYCSENELYCYYEIIEAYLHQKRIVSKHKMAEMKRTMSNAKDSFMLRVRGTELWQSRKRIVVDFVIFFSHHPRRTKRLIVTSRSPDWPK